MIYFGSGSLKIGYTKATGLYAFDGIEFFKILSPYLIRKALNVHKKKDRSIKGTWLVTGHYITAFKKGKNETF